PNIFFPKLLSFPKGIFVVVSMKSNVVFLSPCISIKTPEGVTKRLGNNPPEDGMKIHCGYFLY
ncbi:MAG TPA: hypothetical protein VK618_02710, partial [Flavitalea sp.]|nr:hypothetical protein [Flavitalea sp.]